MTIELGPPKGKMVIIWQISDFEIKYDISVPKIVSYKNKYELYKIDVLNTLQFAKNEQIYRQ